MTHTQDAKQLKDGRIFAIAGTEGDVEFTPDAIPEINHALSFTVSVGGEDIEVRADE